METYTNIEMVSLTVHNVICNVNVTSAFGGWFGTVDFSSDWNNLLASKGAKREIARWVDHAFYYDYWYGSALAFINVTGALCVNSDKQNANYSVIIRGIIIK